MLIRFMSFMQAGRSAPENFAKEGVIYNHEKEKGIKSTEIARDA